MKEDTCCITVMNVMLLDLFNILKHKKIFVLALV